MRFYQQFINQPWHRASISSCPHCHFEPKGGLNAFEFWYQRKRVLEVILSLDNTGWKYSGIQVVSECPQCFKPSWCHLEISHDASFYTDFLKWTEKEVAEITREKVKRLRRGADEFKRGMCATCRSCKGVDWHHFYPRVKCSKAEDWEHGTRSVHHWDDQYSGPCKDYKAKPAKAMVAALREALEHARGKKAMRETRRKS